MGDWIEKNCTCFRVMIRRFLMGSHFHQYNLKEWLSLKQIVFQTKIIPKIPLKKICLCNIHLTDLYIS